MGEPKKNTVSLALDVMGGEAGVGAHILGAYRALLKREQLVVHLFGDEQRMLRHMEKIVKRDRERLVVHHCPDVVTMEDHAGTAARKRESSMYQAVASVKDGICNGVVSAGNSGAMMACALFLLKRIEGMERPAIMVKFPTIKGYTVVLDVGANVDCKAEHLAQFAIMGNTYSKVVEKVDRPRVALLSNGEEKIKGNDLVREASELLERLNLNYIGYVEGGDIFAHHADVIVCDGFVGNVILKCSEGLVSSMFQTIRAHVNSSILNKFAGWMLMPVFKLIKSKTDASEVGAAPLLGVQGNVFICHGNSNARALEAALYKAYDAAHENLAIQISEAAHGLASLVEPKEVRS